MNGPVGVGIIGAGNISDQYLTHLSSFPDVKILAIGDLFEERARAQAAKYGVPRSGCVDLVLNDPAIEIVVNLTIPAAHVGVSESIIGSGKHVWSEKPIGIDREESQRLLQMADVAGLRVGIAPDTVLGPGVQTAKRAIARGDIGRPLFASTAFQWQGPELWHPDPAFLYAKGGGPLLDMGPYYVSTLIHVFGAVAAVAALGLQGAARRRVHSGERAGQEFPVEILSTLSVLMEFEKGGQAQSLYSTDSSLKRHGVVEINGTEGTLVIPDPNMFGGEITIIRPLADSSATEQERLRVPQEGVLTGRGVGVMDMARSLRQGRPHVATGDLGYHVLDTMLSIEEAAASHRFVEVASSPGPIGSIESDFDPLEATL